ncbi:MAG: DUF308 domain-containing protein [Treponema sp.]|nr:DUF308 domain-containing protein [Treponema sp.]
MNRTNFSLGVLIALVGLVMIIAPHQSIRVVVVLLGASAVLNGLYDVITTRTFSTSPLFRRTALIRGLASIVIGLLAICLPLAFAETILNITRYVLAFYMIVAVIIEFVLLFTLPEGSALKKHFVYEALGYAAVAVVLFILKPDSVGPWIIRILGIVILLGGAGYTLYTWKNRTIVVEAENVRDADNSAEKEDGGPHEEN